jgi:recombination protein RecA
MDTEREKRIGSALDKISKQFGKNTIMRLSDKPDMEIEAISSGSISLDLHSALEAFLVVE